MPDVHNLDLHLDADLVLRRLGMDEQARYLAGSKISPTIWKRIRELIDKSDNFLNLSITYDFYRIKMVFPSQLLLENETVLKGSLLSNLFKDEDEVMVAVCTAGYKLDEKIDEYSKNKDILSAYLLDGIGSAAVDEMTDKIFKLAVKKGNQRGLGIIGCISPGREGFTLHEQPKVLKLAHADKIGVKLTSYNMMMPRKSTSIVIGIGTRSKTSFWDKKKMCEYCNFKNRCAYKIMKR